jgi:hypothetical protein
VAIVELFQYPTVGALARHMAGGSPAAGTPNVNVLSSVRDRAQRQRQVAQRKKPALTPGSRT